MNIERIDIGGQVDAIDIQTFVYFLTTVAVISAVLLPEYWRPPTWLLVGWWLIVYLFGKLFVFCCRPFLGGVYTYLTVTEVGMISVLVWTAYRVGKDLWDLEETVANVTLDDVSARVKRLDQSEDDISKELARSRRYDTPLSVMVLKVHPETVEFNIDRTSEDILQGMMRRYTLNKLLRLLDHDLRRTDLVLEQHRGDQVVLVLPETDTEGIDTLADRVRDIAQKQLGVKVTCGYASFPKDALTFDALLEQAEPHLIAPQIDIIPNDVDKTSEAGS
ncbi:MAG: hypothetical protein KKD28_06230 [Chloroflexi bacterium]|nr:hypothetical protein [Chloroflexota bacterium]